MRNVGERCLPHIRCSLPADAPIERPASMTTTTRVTSTIRTTPLWLTGVLAAVAAAVATTLIAAVAQGAGVSFNVDGEPIPLMAFAQLTLFFSGIGVLLAAALNRWAAAPKRTFIKVTAVLIALSFVPDLVLPDATPTKAVLITTHLVAAAIVVPLVAARLSARTR